LNLRIQLEFTTQITLPISLDPMRINVPVDDHPMAGPIVDAVRRSFDLFPCLQHIEIHFVS
jgi:hypothetical protein